MKPQNQEQINDKSIHFGLLFMLLIAFALVPAYFFVWAGGQQKQAFMQRVQQYRQVQNKQILLKDKIDSLYIQMNYVNTEKVGNYLTLETGVSENRQQIASFIGVDSLDNFGAYAHVISHLNDQLFLRDSIAKIVGRENMLKNDLSNCMSHTKGIHRSIFTQTQLSGF